MQKALQQAKIALKKEEVPVGAVIIDKDGVIIARAYNKIENTQCHLAHAEVLAIKKACKKVNNWRLHGCWLVVTLEPCLMCLGLVQLSRLEGVIYGAPSTLFGSGLWSKSNDAHPPYARHLKIEGHIKEKECVELLKTFFSDKRKKRKVNSEAKSRISQENKKSS